MWRLIPLTLIPHYFTLNTATCDHRRKTIQIAMKLQGASCNYRSQMQHFYSIKTELWNCETTHTNMQTHTQVVTGIVGQIQDCSQRHVMESDMKIIRSYKPWQCFNRNICRIYSSENVTSKYGQIHTTRVEYMKPALLWEQLHLGERHKILPITHASAPNHRLIPHFLSSWTVSTVRKTALCHAWMQDITRKTATSSSCERYHTILLPISSLCMNCLSFSASRNTIQHMAFRISFSLIETIAPVFSASPWPGATSLPVLYLPQSLCCSQFSQHASRSTADTVSVAVVFMLQHLDAPSSTQFTLNINESNYFLTSCKKSNTKLHVFGNMD